MGLTKAWFSLNPWCSRRRSSSGGTVTRRSSCMCIGVWGMTKRQSDSDRLWRFMVDDGLHLVEGPWVKSSLLYSMIQARYLHQL